MNNIRTYRFPGYTRFLMAFGVIVFSMFTFFAFRDQQAGAGYFLAGFVLCFLVALLWSLYSIQISDDEIIVTNFLMAKRLAWNEISKVQHKGDGFSLKNHDEDVVLKINSQVSRFPEVLELIKQKIPQVWGAEDITEFHPSGIALWGIFLFGFSGIYMMFAALSGYANEEGNLMTTILLSVFGLLCIGFLFLVTLKVSIENEYLVVLHLGWKQRIHVSEVEEIFLQQTMRENAYYYVTHVKLKNKKALRFTSLREGTFMLATSLKKWLQRFNNPAGQK